jgi:hypothetical protein
MYGMALRPFRTCRVKMTHGDQLHMHNVEPRDDLLI